MTNIRMCFTHTFINLYHSYAIIHEMTLLFLEYHPYIVYTHVIGISNLNIPLNIIEYVKPN